MLIPPTLNPQAIFCRRARLLRLATFQFSRFQLSSFGLEPVLLET
jgi:hypothetical protein